MKILVLHCTTLFMLFTITCTANGNHHSATCQIISPRSDALHLLPHATFDVMLVFDSRIPPLTACFRMGSVFQRCIQPPVVIKQNASHHLLPRLFRVGNLQTQGTTFTLRDVNIFLQDSTTNRTICQTETVDVNSALAEVKLISPRAGDVVVSPTHAITLSVEVVSEVDIHVGDDAYLLVYCQGYPPERLNVKQIMHPGAPPEEIRITLRHSGHVAMQVWLVVPGRMDEIVAMTEVVDVYLTTKQEKYVETVDIAACRYGRMMLPTNDEFVGRSLLQYGEWAELEVELFRELIQPGDTVIDVGANIGAFSLPFAKFVGANGTVLNYEPQRALFNFLCGNLALNGLTNVYPFNLALGSRQSSVLMDVPTIDRPSNLGGFEINEQRGSTAWASSSSTVSQEKIQIVTLDQHLGELQVEKVNFIKIDVEGMELDVLLGGEATLERFRPIVFYENDRIGQHSMLYDFFTSRNYTLFWVVFNLFNHDNYNHRRQNVFPQHLHSYNALAIPTENTDIIATLQGRFKQMLSAGSKPPHHPLQDRSPPLKEWHERLNSLERRMFSQNGEDGVLFEVFNKFGVTNKVYVEIGAGDGEECNTRFLRQFFGWHGVMLDAANHDESIGLYQAFITAENVVSILRGYGIPPSFDLLSVDIDMNDYWVLRALLVAGYSPRVVIVEVNAVLGPTVARSVKYKPERVWKGDDFHGASVTAFCKLLGRDYSLLYCESHGVNCIFVQSQLLESYRNLDIYRGSNVDFGSLFNAQYMYRPPRYFGYDGYQHPAHIESQETEWVDV